jgi:AraC family transcriptional regulator
MGMTDEGSIPHWEPLGGLELLHSTRSTEWTGVVVDETESPPGEVDFPKFPSHLFALQLGGASNLTAEVEGRPFRGLTTRGSIGIIPADTASFWACDKTNLLAFLWLPAKTLKNAAREIYEDALTSVALEGAVNVRDVRLERLMGIMIHELHRPFHPAQRLVYDAASLALAAHVLRSFGLTKTKAPKAAAHLRPHAFRQVVQYIDDNLTSKMRLVELASVAGVSRFHFVKLFRNTIGLTPMAYIERTRVRRAQQMLRRHELSIAEVASVLGFFDQSHFARCFRTWIGVGPGAYRRANAVRSQHS